MIGINTQELEFIIEHTPAEQNIMLVGRHGIGKSEILTQFYSGLHDIPVIPLFLGQMADPGDIIGLPHKNEETGHTEFMPPFWFPVDNKPIVLFLDELNRARPEILQVVQDLVLNKTIAGRRLPDGSRIISAINAGEEYTLTDIDPALLSRFNVYRFTPTTVEWIRWAATHKVHDRVIDFISTHEDMLESKYTNMTDSTEKHADRRSWHRVSEFMKSCPYENCKNDAETLTWRKAIAGIIGDVTGSAFCDYLKEGDMISPALIFKDFDRAIPALNRCDTLRLLTMTMRVCIYVDQADPVHNQDIAKEMADGLIRYVKYLKDEARTSTFGTTSRENAQYFIGEFESGMYPNLSAFINKTPELDAYIMDIIDEAQC